MRSKCVNQLGGLIGFSYLGSSLGAVGGDNELLADT